MGGIWRNLGFALKKVILQSRRCKFAMIFVRENFVVVNTNYYQVWQCFVFALLYLSWWWHPITHVGTVNRLVRYVWPVDQPDSLVCMYSMFRTIFYTRIHTRTRTIFYTYIMLHEVCMYSVFRTIFCSCSCIVVCMFSINRIIISLIIGLQHHHSL